MDLISIFRIALKRWKIVVPVLLLTVAAAARLYTDQSTSYSVAGTQLLMSGRGSQDGQAENAVGVATDLLDDLLLQPAVRQQLTDDGLSGNYEVEVSPTGRTARLDVFGISPEQAVATADALVALAPEMLSETLGSRAADRLAVEQATAAGAENATQEADGSFRYSTVIVVGTSRPDVNTPFPAGLGTVRLMTVITGSTPFRLQFQEANPTATFEVDRNIRESPILQIVAGAPTPEEAITAHRWVVRALGDELDQLQADASVEADRRTQWWTLVEAAYPMPTATSRVRPAAAATVLGTGLAIGLATVVEAVAADRRRRREPPATGEPEQVSTPAIDPEEPQNSNLTAASAETGEAENGSGQRAPTRRSKTRASAS